MRTRLKKLMRPTLVYLIFLACTLAQAADVSTSPGRLRVGVVQMVIGPTIESNRDRIVAGIAAAAAKGVRVAVFPEGALGGQGGDREAVVDEAVSVIQRAAREKGIYVLMGAFTRLPAAKKETQWMLVIGPDGGKVLKYEKLYYNHRAAMPGVFEIDGIPCGTMLCADRWLRGVAEIPIQQGAKISFELSNNYACEWVEPFGWYWYVPRALRNNVWVVFANSANAASGQAATPLDLHHGHSAIIAPDGRLVSQTREDAECVIVADLDIGQANRSEALARSTHPVLRPFWEAGLKIQLGQDLKLPPVSPVKSRETDVTIAVAQGAKGLPEMKAKIREARERGADLVAFPARAAETPALEALKDAARESRITVVFGMEQRRDGAAYNSAIVVGPDGSVLTRYDQLSAASPYQQGTNPASMWFTVKGVPAVVTIGRDALWTEISELAAVAGAQIHVHMDDDPVEGAVADLRRLQVWSNMASFLTFTAVANVTGSMIWDDLHGMDESRAEVKQTPKPDAGHTEVYSPFSANLVARAASGPQLIVATRHIPRVNPHHPRRTSGINPQMVGWYSLGAEIIHPK